MYAATMRSDPRTSRGAIKDKTSWFIKIRDREYPEIVGIGECGPLAGLSPDDRPGFENVLSDTVRKVSTLTEDEVFVNPLETACRLVQDGYPSLKFGIETALLDLIHKGRRIIFENDFVKGVPIPINGLIWMGDESFMKEQVDQKVAQGYKCLKLKVGGLDFKREYDLLRYIRKQFSSDIILRLDANGAFKPNEAIRKLQILSEFNIHSIEQPIKPGLPEMADVCSLSPIPVALDEELIGCENNKRALLQVIRPAYIILKPTLHGGLKNCSDWIKVAESLNIGWWITSALESNIGLNAICQFTANYPVTLPHGLGTGMLYENNFESPLTVTKGEIFYNTHSSWRITE